MFARIGVDMKDVDPQQVTDKCLRYDYIRRDLDQRANSLEQKLEGLKNTMVKFTGNASVNKRDLYFHDCSCVLRHF